MQYMESVHNGIKGEVIDGDTGNFVQNAAVKIRGNGKIIRTTRDGEVILIFLFVFLTASWMKSLVPVIFRSYSTTILSDLSINLTINSNFFSVLETFSTR